MAQIAVTSRPAVEVRTWKGNGKGGEFTVRAETFGERLRRLRRTAGLSQRQLADRAGSTRWSVWAYEHGATMPADTLARFADALATSMGYLWRGKP